MIGKITNGTPHTSLTFLPGNKGNFSIYKRIGIRFGAVAEFIFGLCGNKWRGKYLMVSNECLDFYLFRL